MRLLFCGALGYSFGCFNPAHIIASRNGIDIKQEGSKNAGASNIVLMLGKKRGLITAILDIAKAYFAAMLAQFLLPTFAVAKEVTAAFCVLGHIYPVTLNFRGGKGLACMAGGVLAYNSRLFLILAAAEIVFALLMDYIVAMTLSLAVLLPVLYFFTEKSLFVAGLLQVIGLIVIFKHRENILRIKSGTEVRLSYLWNRDAETQRVTQNMNPEHADSEASSS